VTLLDVDVVKAVPADVTPAFIRRVLRRAAGVPEIAARLPEDRATVAVRITDDAEMRRLNREFAGDDHATDVLSFEGSAGHLGDIAISWQAVVAQAERWGHREKDELSILLIHGLLHLLGWDHATPPETEEMWRLTYTPLRGLRRSPRA
jgi:rRNA maturation RNase YbeY